MYETYRGHAAFFIVYIQEAHPADLWQLPSNVRDGVLFASPKTNGERNSAAASCVRKLGIHIPALLDGIRNPAERAYTGWPGRIYMIGQGGKVLLKTLPGPYGFSAKELDAALAKHARP